MEFTIISAAICAGFFVVGGGCATALFLYSHDRTGELLQESIGMLLSESKRAYEARIDILKISDAQGQAREEAIKAAVERIERSQDAPQEGGE